MVSNWKEKIIDKYPDLFEKEGHRRIQFSCGEGWSWLIDNLCEKISKHVEQKNYPHRDMNKILGLENEKPKEKIDVKITTIKEKFGFLNVYCDGADNEIWSYISFAAQLSTKICEHCGSTQHIGITSGWVRYICVYCAEKDRNRDSWVSVVDKVPIDKYKKILRKEKLEKIQENENVGD